MKELCIFDGPELRDVQGERAWTTVGVSSRTVSLFPVNRLTNQRLGEPISDRSPRFPSSLCSILVHDRFH